MMNYWLLAFFFTWGFLSEIHFPEGRLHDFGQIPQNKEVVHEFSIENTSSKKIRIVEVSTACGCTAVDFPKELAAGEMGKIKIRYDAKLMGIFKKHALVITTCEEQVHKLMISGEVVANKR
ncbi:hypothetical protein A3SI_20187 [Nitritalea halalkaliphila LW7]|uniref:DUF1573 domain-containing protein n=1 Tax=Nitritalea halalkaliphila LW7 TaxID=1189621 RepID=I5BQU0_9BACT|nr:DUF1573 domain-containing protein [Nitritalea halalkaliphila]EIM71942.1 hypothetical protein A3SI_20187 [Nitritalea halalkaliphila LW7]